MSINQTEAEAQDAWDRIATEAADKVAALIPGSDIANDGGGEYIYIPFPGEVNMYGEDLHATVAFEKLEDGTVRNWFIQYDFGVEVWDSEYDYKTDPAVVVAWVNETLAKHRA